MPILSTFSRQFMCTGVATITFFSITISRNLTTSFTSMTHYIVTGEDEEDDSDYAGIMFDNQKDHRHPFSCRKR